MIVFRVAVRVHQAKTSQARALFGELTRASGRVAGVVSFDILQDPDDPARFVSIEVYEDRAAVDRQEKLPELAAVTAAFDDLLSDHPRGTIFHVSRAEPWPAVGERPR
jgi:quinol monooxygenase YgiN